MIPPHILHTMARRIVDLRDQMATLHLLPPEDHLKSILSTISHGIDIQASFAWFGYGAMVSRIAVTEFVALMNDSGWETPFSEDEKRMADNYFTILSNRIPEIWVDKGHPLGHENAFTVGAEGDDRNWKYIVSATAIQTTPYSFKPPTTNYILNR